MGKVGVIAVVLSALLIAMSIVYTNFENAKEVGEWMHKVRYSREKLTHLHFYMHDILTGDSPSALRVANSSITYTTSSTFFGLTNAIDDPLTTTPDPDSELVGQGQGLYAAVGLKQTTVIFAMSFAFTKGQYDGSSLAILGRNPIPQSVREIPIVGGTGIFRFARGYVLAKTYWANATTLDAIVDFNVYVYHY